MGSTNDGPLKVLKEWKLQEDQFPQIEYSGMFGGNETDTEGAATSGREAHKLGAMIHRELLQLPMAFRFHTQLTCLS